MDKHLEDARFCADQVRGTILANNWQPLAKARALKRGLRGSNLTKYVEMVGSYLPSLEDLRNHFGCRS